MRKRLHLDALLLSFMLLGLAAATAQAEIPQPPLGHQLQPVDPPIPAPDFTLPDMDDNKHSLADYRGKVVMLNFWATWCPPCRREMPSMDAVYQSLKDEGLMVLAVNEWEPADHVFAFMGQLSVFPEFPILFDASGSVAEAYAVSGLPTTLVIDAQGMVVYRAIGGRDFEHPEVVELLRELIQGNTTQ